MISKIWSQWWGLTRTDATGLNPHFFWLPINPLLGGSLERCDGMACGEIPPIELGRRWKKGCGRISPLPYLQATCNMQPPHPAQGSMSTLIERGWQILKYTGPCCDLGSTAYITENSVLKYFEPKSQHEYYEICHTISISVYIGCTDVHNTVWGRCWRDFPDAVFTSPS
jgi:hypothetical protein